MAEKTNKPVTFLGNGGVWDKEKNRILCVFKDGKFTTDNERIVTILKSKDYKIEGGDKNGK